MKYCHRPYDYFYIDSSDGDIWLCQWMVHSQGKIGNCITDSVDDCYNSEHANYLRSTLEDGSFSLCRFEACPFLQNNSLPDISAEEYASRKKEKYRPVQVNMAFDFVCNQSCETCRKEVFKPPKDYGQKMKAIQNSIAPYLDTAKYISTSGHGDPFASKYMMDILSNMQPTNPDMQILIETNGVFFDEAHWERIAHLSSVKLDVVVTINSFDPHTYKLISRDGDFERVMENLNFMSKLRKENKITVLSNSFVIQDRNFREIPFFIQRSFQGYAFDYVVLKPVYQWGTMDDDVYWFKDVLNPSHPYHQEYLEIISDPIVQDKRVYNFAGDTVHERCPYPSGTDTSQIADLQSRLHTKELRICELEACVNSLSGAEANALVQQDERITALRNKIDTQLAEAEQKLEDIYNSTTWKAGRAITFIPRLFRNSGGRR